MWDVLGVEETLKKMETAGMKPAKWVYDMLQKGKKSFYSLKNGQRLYYDISSADYMPQKGTEGLIILDANRSKTIWKNSGADLIDVGDGILNLEFLSLLFSFGVVFFVGVFF